jgi:hypothetical protein
MRRSSHDCIPEEPGRATWLAEGIAISILPVEDHKRPICDGLGTIISYWRGLRGGSQGIFIEIIW